RTLVEAARTMLIFSRASLFLWAEAIATACFTQNSFIIHRRFFKTPCELINGRKPDISYLHVSDALCYPKNDREDIGKLCAKGDIGFFIGYFADSCAYRIYNQRTKKIMETMNVTFDELSAMAFEQRSSKPRLQSITSGQISSGLDLTYAPSTITTQQPTEGELDSLFEAMYDDYFGGQPSATRRSVSSVQEPQVCQTSTASITIADTAPIPTNASFHATNIPITSQDVDELNSNDMVDENTHVYKLKKALYRLKQAPRAWYDELSTFLLQNNFIKGTIDLTVFIRRFHDDILVVQVYVDDIIFGSSYPRLSQMRSTSRRLKGSFAISEVPLTWAFGIRRILVLNKPDFQMLIMRDVKTPSRALLVELNSWVKSCHSHILQPGSTFKNKTHCCLLPFHKGARGKGSFQLSGSSPWYAQFISKGA
nr:retrovirus-related Pol polyprotein from transposon TNT 1-94 [Tanacetum cinerariifolium]